MNWKETYTKIFLNQANITITPATIKEYTPLWWQNTRTKNEGGLRLTDQGFAFLKNDLNLQFYEIPFPKDFIITTQVIIFLDKFITCPYYFTNKTILVTDEKKSLELHLFSGDIRKYGLNKALSRHKD